MPDRKVLLLNASNMDAFPVYPYAFIQVPAIARRAGIDVICQELLGVPQEQWRPVIESLISQHRPAVILVTLRNTDSLVSQDYERDGSQIEGGRAYFPVERTKELIAVLRQTCDLNIALGGFGFSVMPEELMHYLRPDFGVRGDPNDFFAQFEDVQTGALEQVANLLYFRRGQLIANPRKFYPPLSSAEYTPEAIQAMMAFYDSFPDPGFLGAPVEIMRGCCHSCLFCCEPHVAGDRVRYRDLPAVMGDIEILASQGITRIYMISSELNPEGNEFVLGLADRIRSFNARHTEGRRVTWFGANYLLNFSADEFEHLYSSGFTGGWFDITALDDENARAMRTPYRNKSLLASLKAYVHYQTRRLGRPRSVATSQPTEPAGEQIDPKQGSLGWSLFLGNPATTTETIRNTLRVANREGLAQLFQSCHLNKNIRVFEYERPDAATRAVSYSVAANLARTGYQELLPSFAYPPALLRDFGSEAVVSEMFDHIADTYLSTTYQTSRHWCSFVRHNATAESLAAWVTELGNVYGMQVAFDLTQHSAESASPVLHRLFSDEPRDEPESFECELLAKQIVDSLLSGCLKAFPDLFRDLGLPATMEDLAQKSSYHVAVAVFRQWQSEQDLLDGLAEQAPRDLSDSMRGFLRFCMWALLYRMNVQIKPAYRRLFIAG